MFEPDKFYRKEKSDLTAADFLLLEILLAATLIIILLFLKTIESDIFRQYFLYLRNWLEQSGLRQSFESLLNAMLDLC